MEYRSLDQVRADSVVTRVAPPLTRGQRLRRWAELLEAVGRQPLPALRLVEFYAEPERRRLRLDGSAIAVAFGDPVLRASGLAGDTLWDAETFFGLSKRDTHRIVCDCRHPRPTGRSTARLVRGVARIGFLRRLWR